MLTKHYYAIVQFEENTVAFLKEEDLLKLALLLVFTVARKLNFIRAKKGEKNEP